MTIPEELGFLVKKLRSKHRSWIRRKQRELDSAFPGKVSWQWMSSFDDVPELCARLEVVAGRTCQRGLSAGFVDDEDHRQRFALLASRGQLRVQMLEIEGKVRAFWIGTIYQGVFYSSATGYDPDLGAYEPGTLIFVRMVDELVRERVYKLDFGLGDASYKQRFGDESWRETTIRLFAPTVKGLAIRSILGFSRTLDVAGRHMLGSVGGLDRLKTAWRRRVAPSRTETKGK
jgi:CelD/BcsL family acetyltransferase involved in cellulose biosynthesis